MKMKNIEKLFKQLEEVAGFLDDYEIEINEELVILKCGFNEDFEYRIKFINDEVINIESYDDGKIDTMNPHFTSLILEIEDLGKTLNKYFF